MTIDYGRLKNPMAGAAADLLTKRWGSGDLDANAGTAECGTKGTVMIPQNYRATIPRANSMMKAGRAKLTVK